MDIKGFVNINKPSGMTSSDVVVKVRGILRRATGQKLKVGHLGTLDPLGRGVLPIAVGSATRLFDYMQEKVKVYRATFVFGKTTDTLDSAGKITDTSENLPSIEQIQAVFDDLCGEVDQIPPQYSAKSVGGVRAYDLARQGIDVELKPKRVHIYYIKNVDIDENGNKYSLDENEYAFEIACSSGTYIRSIARDLATKLNTVGYMSSILRIKSGEFVLNESVSLADFEKEPLRYLNSFGAILNSFAKFDIPSEYIEKVQNGVKVAFDNMPEGNFIACVDGQIFGMAQSENGCLKVKVRL